MADVLYFSRDTKAYIEIGDNIWEIPILDGFSFSQATNSTEISLNEMSDINGTSRRGMKKFNDSYAPAEWSMSTYIRPFVSTGTGDGASDDVLSHHAVEEALWALMVGTGVRSDISAAGNTYPGVTPTLSNMVIDFDDSNKTTLGTCKIWFVLGATAGENEASYSISEAVVNEASIEFDIDGIATIAWSGFGSLISDETTPPTATLYEATTATNNFIRNRLTTLVITGTGSGNFESTYDITLTGGNVTVSNNMTFLTPETLGIVNQPLGHVTGSRTIMGSFTCYLNADTSETDHSIDLFEDLIESTTTITNQFGLNFKVGGPTAVPRIELNMAQAHLEIPTHSLDDVVALEVNFSALGTAIDATDELVITYVGS